MEFYGNISSNLLWIAVSISLIYLINKIWKHLTLKKKLSKIPLTKETKPIVGDLFKFIKTNPLKQDLIDLIANYICCDKEGITRLSMLTIDRVILYKADTVKPALNNKITDKGNEYELLRGWLGDGLILSSGEKWHKRRKILTPAFHFQILEDFLQVFHNKSQILLRKISQSIGEPQDMHSKLTLCTLDIIIETSLGRVINAQDNNEHEYVNAVLTQGKVVVTRRFRPHLEYDWIFRWSKLYKQNVESLRILNGFSNESINLRKKERVAEKILEERDKKPTKKRQAILDLLLKRQEEEGDISDEEIKNELNSFIFAGHDTTGSALSFTLWLLGNYPEKQKKLHAELDEIFGESDRPATLEDYKKMTYLECVIKESLRLYPPVIMIAKRTDNDVIITDEYTIPSNVDIFICIYMLHRDPAYFPNPEEFEPERFLPENTLDRHSFAFLPFSGGPRNCIGQRFALLEEKVVLSSIFRKFRSVSVKKRHQLRIKVCPVLMPEDGKIDIIFYPR